MENEKMQLGVVFDTKTGHAEVNVPSDPDIAVKLFMVLTDACMRAHGENFPNLVEDAMVGLIEMGIDRKLEKTIEEEKKNAVKN